MGMRYDQEKTQAPPTPFELDREVYAKRHAYENSQNGCDAGSAPVMSDEQILKELFRYHAPNESTLPKYAAINQAAKNFAEVVLQNCPPSADRSAAIRLIRDARMTANAAIALNGLSL